MKIRITDIAPEGLEVDGVISAAALNTRMREGRETDISFTTDPRVEMTVYATASGAYSKGAIRAKVKQPCGMCVEDIEREITVEGNFIFQRRDAGETTEYLGETDTYFDDVGVNYFTGEHIDLEDIIQESIILTLSPYWKPPQNEDGSCSICGKIVQLEEKKETGKTSLGQLLKNAGVR